MDEKHIDIVYRWIDPIAGSEKLKKALIASPIALRGHMNCVNRFRDNGELKYSLRSVSSFVPWIRFIHILGEGPSPDWLDTRHPINWINLSEFMEAYGHSIMPLNSETQKLYLSKIIGLADNFISMDDDWFFGGAVDANHFYTDDGMPIQPSNDGGYGGHAPIAWTRELYDLALAALPTEVFASVKSGGVTRVDPMPLMREFLQQEGLAKVSEDNNAQIWLQDTRHRQYPRVLREIIETAPVTFCINDDWSINDIDYVEEMEILHQFFETMYPAAASWEKVDCRRIPQPLAIRPIRISAHAFGFDEPRFDLLVSPAQDICVKVLGDVRIPAILLVNGSTIQRIEYKSLPNESDLEFGKSNIFAGAVIDLAAAPLVDSAPRTPARLHEMGPVVDAVKAQLHERAESLGWTLTTTLELQLVVDGQHLNPILRDLTARFHVPAGATDVWLVCPTARPCDTVIGCVGDDRQLGLYIRSLRIEDGLSMPRDVAIDHPLLRDGFLEVEDGRRWTTDRARLPAALWDGFEEDFFLRIEFFGLPVPRWITPLGNKTAWRSHLA